jgi:L-lysine 2,3-aminomutase
MWQQTLANGFSNAIELVDYLGLSRQLVSIAAQSQFKTRIPKRFVEKMAFGDAFDPLLRQVLAVDDELQEHDEYDLDPLGEKKATKLPGMLHKYHGRVLLTLSASCAINCRYCFRRHFDYTNNNPGKSRYQKAIAAILRDDSIHEVILSGGDPLLANDDLLKELITSLEGIKHVKTLRIHSRIPIVLPERITPAFLTLVKKTPLNTVMVFHCNHPNELDNDIKGASSKLKEAGCHLLNQSVLLKGVNDDVDTLVALSHQLFSFGIMPYYLHLLDKVSGAAHFEVTLCEAQQIYKDIQSLLPGYLVPKLVQEIAGRKNKTIVI